MRRSVLSIASTVGLAAAVWIGVSAASEPERVLGVKPGYTDRGLSEVPNAAAMTDRIWVPGLDRGYVPQGLTFLDGAIYLGTYRSEDPKQGRGPCRIYRIDPRGGAVTGVLDLPPQCGHAGGLARGRPGQLWVADTRDIFEISLDQRGGTIGHVARSIRLAGDLKGSFAAGTADALWLGTYSKETGARLYKVPFEKLAGAHTLSEQDAAAAVALPTEAQGAAFDHAGRLWITRSGSTFGELLQLDHRSGAIVQRFAMPAGLEDISFDLNGELWAVGEAGSRRWLGWKTFFPLVFRLQPAALR